MASEGYSSQVELQPELVTTQGHSEKRAPPKHPKSKSPAVRKLMEARLTTLEQVVGSMQVAIGKLSDDHDELMQENAEVTSIVKKLIEDLGQSF